MTNEGPPKAPSPPKGWLNKLMMVMLHTPGLQRIIGGSVALITFEGSKTGRTYTTPVSYSCQDGTVVVLSRASRVWWRNLTDGAQVSLRMAGRVVSVEAQAQRASEADLATLVDFFENRKMDAKAYGVSLRQDGRPSEADVRALLPNIVVIRINQGRCHGSHVEKGEKMTKIEEAASEFLTKERIAVTGVSRKAQGHGSNMVYQRLRERGYEVFAVNPNAETVEGDQAYPDLGSIPGGVDAVVIGTRPEVAEETMRECADLGIGHVWMHRSFGEGSVSEVASEYGRKHGITVIDGGCPCMFDPTADPGHKAMRFVFTLTGKVPREV